MPIGISIATIVLFENNPPAVQLLAISGLPRLPMSGRNQRKHKPRDRPLPVPPASDRSPIPRERFRSPKYNGRTFFRFVRRGQRPLPTVELPHARRGSASRQRSKLLRHAKRAMIDTLNNYITVQCCFKRRQDLKISFPPRIVIREAPFNGTCHSPPFSIVPLR